MNNALHGGPHRSLLISSGKIDLDCLANQKWWRL